MLKVKDTLRATVNLTFDGRVMKTYHGRDAAARFENEVKILKLLRERGCDFCPRLLEADKEKIRIITSNCGSRVEHLDEPRRLELFAELEKFGIRHDDPDVRNVTYRTKDGRFCIIDFEFATILPDDSIKQVSAQNAALHWSAHSDIGKVRKNNEDSFLGLLFNSREVQRLGKVGDSDTAEFDCVFAVCDGMGGAKAGEYASKIAVDKITTLLPSSFRKTADVEDTGEVLMKLFGEIHRALVYLGNSYDECHGMETTMSLCWFTPERMYYGHVGDSRIYHLSKRHGGIKQITDDDTHVGWLFRNGKINEREARDHPRRSVLQKALGGSNQFVDPQVGAISYERGDIFLICSDGLVDGLYNDRFVEILRERKTGKETNAARELVIESIEKSGRDNTTAVVIQIV